MRTAIRNYLIFLWRSLQVALVGDWRYYAWIGVLALISIIGLNAYAKQLAYGLVVTGMSDQVSWGVYIANFTFLVGVAAAAVMMVIPVYIYKNEELHDLVIFGELLAVAAIIMCLAFVTVDLGRPDRFWHLIPGIGVLNFPASMLSWDVIVLNGYLLLNIHICGYILYCRYQRRMPAKWFYVPFVFIAIVWAISIHTVTAFLYVGLGGRHFWNSAIVGPRFLASAFTAGPALIILAMQVVRRVTSGPLPQSLAHSIEQRPAGSIPQRPATAKDILQLARNLPELTHVPKEGLDTILAGATVLDVPAHVPILYQGETDRDAFFVLEGRVAVERKESGRYRMTRSVGAGEQFGEISALAGTPRVATAIAEEATQVLRLPSDSLRELMKTPQMERIVHARMTERLMITDRALMTLRGIVQVAMIVNVFLLACEVFAEFYAGGLHVTSSRYLFLGLHGYYGLVPWIWTAITFNLTAMVLLLLPVSRGLKWLNVACVLAIIGIWIEKGMGLVVPGFIPTPLGEMVEYQLPSLNETLVCLGIWAFGLLLYTVFLRMAVPILQGKLTQMDEQRRTKREAAPVIGVAPAA